MKFYKIADHALKFENKLLMFEEEIPLPPVAAMTLRIKFDDPDFVPSYVAKGEMHKVEESEFNIWDWTYNNSDWNNAFSYMLSDVSWSVIDAGDTRQVTNMRSLFDNCTSLKSVCPFNISMASDLTRMFAGCINLESIPEFTSVKDSVTMDFMCATCLYAKTGILSLYQKAISTRHGPGSHNLTFFDCGVLSESGSAELAQIPSDWK